MTFDHLSDSPWPAPESFIEQCKTMCESYGGIKFCKIGCNNDAPGVLCENYAPTFTCTSPKSRP